MKRSTTLAAAGLLGTVLAFAPLAWAQAPSESEAPAIDIPSEGEDSVVATVAGAEIYESELALALADLDPQFGQLPVEQRRVAALAALIDIKLLAARATESGIADSEAFERRMGFLRDRALHNSYFQDEILASITDEDVRARYDTEVEAMPPMEEINARHILVETEADAVSLIEQLDGGADFAELAQEHSSDGSAQNGGDLGYFQRGQMVAPFEEAAFALETGSHTAEPVESQFGWHVIKLEDRRTAEPPAYEQVREQVRQIVLRERYLEVLDTARDEAEIEITDAELNAAYQEANQEGEDGEPAAQ